MSGRLDGAFLQEFDAPTADELDRMREHVRRAMTEGAMGVRRTQTAVTMPRVPSEPTTNPRRS